MTPQRKNTLIIYGASFFWTMTTLMVFSTLPIYHESVLKLSKQKLGSIQAWASVFMYGTKFFSGLIIDTFKNYKAVLILGSFLSMIGRPLFAYVDAPLHIALLRAFERLTKGLRASPTDAFLTINQEQEAIGQSVAYKQIYYTTGAMAGAIFSSAFLYFYPDQFATLYKISLIPGLIATLLLFKIEPIPFTQKESKSSFNWRQIKDFPPILYFMYFLSYAVTVSRAGETFVSHLFNEHGMPTVFLPLVHLLYNFLLLLISVPLVKKLDQHDSKNILLSGVLFLFFANFLLFASPNLYGLIAGVICTGIYVALLQGILITAIAKFTPKEIRGTAFSIFYIIGGFAVFTSSKLTGYFAHTYNSWKMGFLGQTVISLILLIFIPFIPKKFFKD